MSFTIKKMTMSLVAAGAVSFAAMGVDAGGPVALTDSQLDRVNAGDTPPVFAGSAAAAAGLGLRVFGGTQTTAVTVIGSPGNDGPFGGSTAQAGAYAFGGGLNGVSPGSGAANATTATEAPGNLTVHIGMNYTVYGIGTVAQGSISSSTGLFVPGLP